MCKLQATHGNAKDELKALGATDEEIATATASAASAASCCGGSGYKGRVALYEVMPFKDALKELVLQGAAAVEIKAEAIRVGMRTRVCQACARSARASRPWTRSLA